MSTKQFVTAILAAAVAAGAFALPTTASAGDRHDRWEHRDRWQHGQRHYGPPRGKAYGHWNHRDRWQHGQRHYGPPHGKAYGHWKHKHYRPYYQPGYVVRPYAPPVVVYPAAPYSAYPAYPAGNGSFSITYQGWF